jgi:hypothetical protein
MTSFFPGLCALLRQKASKSARQFRRIYFLCLSIQLSPLNAVPFTLLHPPPPPQSWQWGFTLTQLTVSSGRSQLQRRSLISIHDCTSGNYTDSFDFLPVVEIRLLPFCVSHLSRPSRKLKAHSLRCSSVQNISLSHKSKEVIKTVILFCPYVQTQCWALIRRKLHGLRVCVKRMLEEKV